MPSRCLKSFCLSPLIKKGHFKGWPAHRTVWNVGKIPDCHYFLPFHFQSNTQEGIPKTEVMWIRKTWGFPKHSESPSFGMLEKSNFLLFQRISYIVNTLETTIKYRF